MKSLNKPSSLLLLFLYLLLIPGCIAFRSDMDGTFNGDTVKKSIAKQVSTFFLFTHLEQQKGYDVVPKIVQPPQGFRNIFGESMKELTNIKSYSSFTENELDVDDINRRHLRDSLKQNNDYTIHVTFSKEDSFVKEFFGDLIMIGTLTILPAHFSWDYTIKADITNRSGVFLKSYTRHFTLSRWNNILLIFVYPFYPVENKTGEIYFESLRDIFRQIEAEGVLGV